LILRGVGWAWKISKINILTWSMLKINILISKMKKKNILIPQIYELKKVWGWVMEGERKVSPNYCAVK
jgi:hypothetical protein